MIKSQAFPVISKKNIPKMKKDAFSMVDREKERELDPKYKTELCKSFSIKQFCIYGNKCRFAHGKSDLYKKSVESNDKYKKKKCKSFFDDKFCLYGSRCHFKHNETELKEINISHYFFLLCRLVFSSARKSTVKCNQAQFTCSPRTGGKRLRVFSEIILEDETADNSIEYANNSSDFKNKGKRFSDSDLNFKGNICNFVHQEALLMKSNFNHLSQ